MITGRKTIPKEMKEKLQEEKKIMELNERIRMAKEVHTPKPEPNKTPIIIPENLTGNKIKKIQDLIGSWECYRKDHPTHTDVLYQYIHMGMHSFSIVK